MKKWPYLEPGIDAGLTESQSSLLMGCAMDHQALIGEPQRSLRSMLKRCPELFDSFECSGRLHLFPNKAGTKLAWHMHDAWEEYMDNYSEGS